MCRVRASVEWDPVRARENSATWTVIVGAGVGVALAAVVALVVVGGPRKEGRAPVEGIVPAAVLSPPARERPAIPAPEPRQLPAKAPPPVPERPAVQPSPAPAPPAAPGRPSRISLIAGYETQRDLKMYENLAKVADVTRMTRHATEGRYSLKVEPIEGKRARLAAAAWLGMKKDWSWAERLCLDVYVEEGAPLPMTVGIRDKEGGSEWDRRRNISFTLKEGANPIKYRIAGLIANDRKRKMVLSDVYQFQVYFPADRPFVVYVDNVRLEK